MRPVANKPIEYCSICGIVMDQEDLPETSNCGGDCLMCMAESGDPGCIVEVCNIVKERKGIDERLHNIVAQYNCKEYREAASYE